MSEICASLHHLFSGLERFAFPFAIDRIPRNGIYVLFELGEHAHGVDRIVRVGTHTGTDQLPSRLQQHFVKENKDRSIFRKHIGRAILSRVEDLFLEQWNWDLTSRKDKDAYGKLLDYDKQAAVEKQVTTYIQTDFSFVVFEVVSKVERLNLEAKIISTVSWCDDCRPSNIWLGLHSPEPKIRQSGLWLVNELYKEPLSEQEFMVIKSIVERG